MRVKAPPAPKPPCPRADVINVIQYQLFDNGPKPGRGKSQHVVMTEVYCESRLNLLKPYWKRAVPLVDPKKFMAWVTQTHSAEGMSDHQYAIYEAAHDAVAACAASGQYEIAKLGHIGSNDKGTTYYVGQFLICLKEHGGGPTIIMNLGDDALVANSFLYDKLWRPGGKRRKFFGFHDPQGLYEAMKRERAFNAAAEARGGVA